MTLTQAVRKAHEAGRKLDEIDLRKHCRQTYAAQSRAAYLTADGIRTGGQPSDYGHPGHGGGRGIWLIREDALQERLDERAQGPGPRSRQRRT